MGARTGSTQPTQCWTQGLMLCTGSVVFPVSLLFLQLWSFIGYLHNACHLPFIMGIFLHVWFVTWCNMSWWGKITSLSLPTGFSSLFVLRQV